MFNFWRKSNRVEPNLSFLSVDMHSHLLPALDDGLKHIDDTISFLKEFENLGYQKCIATPHILAEVYPNSPATILPQLQFVKDNLVQQGLHFQIDAAAEYMMDHHFEQNLKMRQPILSIAQKYVLVEMSYIAPSPNFREILFELRVNGYIPILAHPERYSFYFRSLEQLNQFRELGCMFQINILSLSGYYGKPVKQVAEWLIAKKMVEFLGTDLHHQNHLNILKSLATSKRFYETVKPIEWKNKELL